jgi:hypothetical protein
MLYTVAATFSDFTNAVEPPAATQSPHLVATSKSPPLSESSALE